MSCIFKKAFLLFTVNAIMNMKKYLKTKILDLINNIEEYKETHNHGSKNHI